MNPTATPTAEANAEVDWSSKVRIGSPKTATPVQGRRAFFNYKDQGGQPGPIERQLHRRDARAVGAHRVALSRL